jgi:hypothetical protein
MKPFEIIARRAENHLRESRQAKDKLSMNQSYNVTVKDATLTYILDCVSWLDRLPGSKEKKAPYTKRIWDCYLAVQQGRLDDTTMIPQILGGNRVTYLEDQAVETSIADNGIGTGGLGYASVRSQDIGTAYRGKQANPYFRKVKGSPARTLEGEEKAQAYAEYLVKVQRKEEQ